MPKTLREILTPLMQLGGDPLTDIEIAARCKPRRSQPAVSRALNMDPAAIRDPRILPRICRAVGVPVARVLEAQAREPMPRARKAPRA